MWSLFLESLVQESFQGPRTCSSEVVVSVEVSVVSVEVSVVSVEVLPRILHVEFYCVKGKIIGAF